MLRIGQNISILKDILKIIFAHPAFLRFRTIKVLERSEDREMSLPVQALFYRLNLYFSIVFHHKNVQVMAIFVIVTTKQCPCHFTQDRSRNNFNLIQ